MWQRWRYSASAPSRCARERSDCAFLLRSDRDAGWADTVEPVIGPEKYVYPIGRRQKRDRARTGHEYPECRLVVGVDRQIHRCGRRGEAISADACLTDGDLSIGRTESTRLN